MVATAKQSDKWTRDNREEFGIYACSLFQFRTIIFFQTITAMIMAAYPVPFFLTNFL